MAITATTYNNIAGVYDSQGDYPMALEWYQKAFPVLLKKLGPEHPHVSIVFENMKHAYDRSGNTQDFEEWVQEMLAKSPLFDHFANGSS